MSDRGAGSMNWKHKLRNAILILVISFMVELLVFNHKAFISWNASNQSLEIARNGSDYYVYGMEGAADYTYIGIKATSAEYEGQLTTLSFAVRDEGSEKEYSLDPVAIYLPVEKSKYLRFQTYGDMKLLIISVDSASADKVEIAEVIYDAKVPFFFSFLRMMLIFSAILICRLLRPGSELYRKKWKTNEKICITMMMLVANMLLYLVIVRSNPAFLHPVWPYHQQYYQLARALSQGQVSVDFGYQGLTEALSQLSNPYDTGVRMAQVPESAYVWDVAFFQGKLYVYFGVVPVLIFYLPYYLIFHGAFPTWLGVYLSGCGVLSGVYYLLNQIRKKYFPDSPYLLYLIFSTIVGNSIHLTCALLRADFYYLPIVMALAFSLWGLGLISSAMGDWYSRKRSVNIRLLFGAGLLALTAGCRPQFLIASFLTIPIILPCITQTESTVGKKQLVTRMTCFVLPYVIVAGGMMAYNFARFGSFFDFGANYNLTTNDMTRRGLKLGRIPDGLFTYLVQFPVIKLIFPFVEMTSFYSTYLGGTVKDWVYGGALWTHGLFFSLLGIGVVRQDLKRKGVYSFTIGCIISALVVILADTEMSGLMNRYYMDFLWLFQVAAVVVLYQLLERWQGSNKYDWLIRFILIAGICAILMEMAIALHSSGIANDNIHRFYMLKSLFQ